MIQNPVARFVFRAVSLYLVWYFVYEIGLKPLGTIDSAIIDNLVVASEFLLTLFNFTLIGEFPVEDTIRTLGIDGTTGVWVGEKCDGLSLFALFSGLIIAFPGNLKSKFWFIPLGIMIIHIINIIRITILCIIQWHDYTLLDFNHNYTFTSFMYVVIFALWYYWISRLSGIKSNSENE